MMQRREQGKHRLFLQSDFFHLASLKEQEVSGTGVSQAPAWAQCRLVVEQGHVAILGCGQQARDPCQLLCGWMGGCMMGFGPSPPRAYLEHPGPEAFSVSSPAPRMC